MATATKTKSKSNSSAIHRLVSDHPMLTENDLTLLAERDDLKAELKRLDTHLKERITNTINKLGEGRFVIGEKQVELSRSIRSAISWKSLAHAVASEADIAEVRADFTVDSNVDKCSVMS